MAYVNVAEWTPEHVADWLRGLEDPIFPYVHFFLNNNVDGNHLLNLSPDDLNHLHISKVGHQQLILEAVDFLRQLHYGLTSETLQFLALKLGCKARSLHNDLKLNGPQENLENAKQERVSTDTLSAVSNILVSVKSMVSWLDRYPFAYQDQYVRIRKAVSKLSIELASTAQRDQFVENPHYLIKSGALNLAELCDRVVQEFNDSLIIQPASLDIATLKKKPDEELGMHIKSTYSGFHIIARIKPQSPTTRCTKVEEGDEIVQVNYQTVIGWQQQKLLCAMSENPTEIHLTLKKRPRHTNLSGQVIILRPYRIPSKKTAFGKVHKWSEGNSLHIQEVYSTSNDNESIRDETIDDDDDDSAFFPDEATVSQMGLINDDLLHYRAFVGITHATVQRRATVSGASPTVLKAPINIEDLVNGVPIIKKRENIGRSISHDPSKLTASFERSLSCNKPFDLIKLNDYDKNIDSAVIECAEDLENYSPIAAKSSLSNFNVVQPSKILNSDQKSSSNFTIPLVKKKRNSVLTSDTLSLEEEEYTILESKSLENDKSKVSSFKEISNFSEILQDKKITLRKKFDIHQNMLENQNYVSLDDAEFLDQGKSNSVLYPWEAADTSFLGRRPSIQDISDEIAGSKISDIDQVFLKKASKLNVSYVENEENAKVEDLKDCSSYQITIVGGVPQKCVAVSKGGKRSSDHSVSHLKKKTSIAEKVGNRRISCKDLGKGDCQGWLYKQKEKRGFFPTASQWTMRWIVLKSHYLYSYKDINDVKAECLIFLPGSTVSPAKECKSKKYCFKICQQKTTFYFATESQSDLSKWMNKMGLAAIAYDLSSDETTSGFQKPQVILGVESNFYSETDDSDDSSYKELKQMVEEKHKSAHESSQSSSLSDSSNSYLLKSGRFNNIMCDSSSKQFIAESNSKGINEIHGRSNGQSHLRLNNKTKSNYEHSIVPQIKQPSTSIESHKISLIKKNLNDQIQESQFQPLMYNRSFSYTESAVTTNKEAQSESRLLACDETSKVQSLPYKFDTKYENSHCQQSSTWMVTDEEYDILTSSLGRQKVVAKEITPGLVARMAVSYSNLSQRNSSINNSALKAKFFKETPAPGYVAKISDSFDYLARKSSNISMCQPLSKSKSTNRQLSPSENKLLSNSQHSNYRRSSSETQIKKKNDISSQLPISGNASCQVSFGLDKISKYDNGPVLQHVSMLDREYNRVYGGKKVVQMSIKSSIPQDFFTKNANSQNEKMKFFPNSEQVSEMQEHDSVNYTNCNSKNSFNDAAMQKPRFSNIWRTGITVEKINSVQHQNPFVDLMHNQHQECSHVQSVSKAAQKTTDFKSQIHSASIQQTEKPYCDLSRGIENVGFYSSDSLSENNEQICVPSQNSSVYNEDVVLNNNQTFIESYTKTCTNDNACVKLNSAFKLFGSPKFMKKLSSPKLDKKNIFKSKKQAKELKNAEQKELKNVQCERKFLGSPRLGRAIFGSPKSSKTNVITVSSGVQTDVGQQSCKSNDCFMPSKPEDSFLDLSLYEYSSQNCSIDTSGSEQGIGELIKSSSNSSLNSDVSSSILSASSSSQFPIDAKEKHQITLGCPLVTDVFCDERGITPETPRTPLKPTMGITMLGKRRLPSISGESTISITSKGSQEESLTDPIQARTEVKMEIKDGAVIDKNGNWVQIV